MKDDNEKWSLYEARSFYISETPPATATNITVMEYFIGSDPGVGNGTNVSITENGQINMDIPLDMTGENIGDYAISFRIKDDKNNWSIADTRDFSIASCTQPVPDFSFTTGALHEILFTDLSTSVDASATYSWDIDNDGTEDYNTVGNISHTYTTSGTHTASLTITNDGGCSYKTTKVLDVATGIIGTLEHKQISIYPNPTNGNLAVEFDNNSIQKIVISDLSGKSLVVKTNYNANETIDLSNFNKGIYIISIQTENETFTSKIVKE